MLANERDNFGWVHVANDDRLATKRHACCCPTAATNVEERHGNKVDRAISELPDLCSKWNERKEVVVGEHDTLRPARCAA